MTAPKPRRRSIRFAIVAVVCLLLGAVTTVGVAWGVRIVAPRYDRTKYNAVGWPWPVPAEWGWSRADVEAQPELSTLMEGPGRSDCWSSLRIHVEPLYAFEGMAVDRSGWPALSMVSVRGLHEDKPSSERWRFVSYRQGLGRWDNAAPMFGAPKWLPLLPLFPGFALDTALYAAAWYLVIFTPLPLIRAGRRRFRVSRGMCPACAYDLKGSPAGPCPECGSGARGKP